MPVKVIMPQLGETVAEGTITQWLVKEGDALKKDQPIVAVSTDKAEVEIPSPETGILSKILIEAGKTVPIGTELAMIEQGEKAKPSPESPPVKGERPTQEHVQGKISEQGKPSRLFILKSILPRINQNQWNTFQYLLFEKPL